MGLDRALIGTGFPYRANIQYLDNYMAMMKVVMQAPAFAVRRRCARSRLRGRWTPRCILGVRLVSLGYGGGNALITEAGGLVGTLTGGEYKHQGHILAGSPKVYAALLEALAPHVPSRCAGVC